ncbi:hypothetical protein BC833DRAFT_603097 [Globomyces pollinis-pini]|nr:hypothetical protein BC833DRAFT_603097 [Globomyces pollinis-pini]
MSQFPIETATSLAFVSGITYPFTLFTLVSAAYQLKKNQSYRVISIFLSSFFSALILLTYPARWLPYGVPTGLRLMWFIGSNLALGFISVAGIHRYSTAIINDKIRNGFIIAGYVTVWGILLIMTITNVFHVMGLTSYSTIVNSLAIVIPIGHIILTTVLIARNKWKNDLLESFATVTQIFTILIAILWTVWLVLLFTISTLPVYLIITLLLLQITILLENRIQSFTEIVYNNKKKTNKIGNKSNGLESVPQ